jgi:hypothetical protein
MNPIAERTRRAAFWLRCLWLLASPVAWAEDSVPAPPANDPLSPAPYVDHYIAGGSLAPDISIDDSGTSDSAGLARSLRLDGVLSVLTGSGAGAPSSLDEYGVVLSSQWDTASYGAWSAELAARGGGSRVGEFGAGQSVVTLIERGMPFDGSWNADGAIGDLNLPTINLARFQSRFFLPTGPVLGLSAQWRGPSGLQLVAGGGEPGLYEGVAVPTFATLGGSTATLGAQWSPAQNWTVGGQLAEARDVTPFASALSAVPDRTNSTTGFLSTAWQGRSARAQLNVLSGSMSGTANSFGTWIDATATQGRFLQSFGAFRIDPNLSWGNQLITDDLQGGYYHLDYQSRRWFADVGIDQAWSVSGLGADTTFISGDTRYQLSRDLGIGGVANLRRAEGAFAWSIEGYLDSRNRWGIGRGQADYARDDVGTDATVTLNQAWNTMAGTRLSTSVAYQWSTSKALLAPPQSSSEASLSINGGGDLTARLGFDANVRWGVAFNGPGAPAVMANVALTWKVAREWLLLASFYEYRMGSWAEVTVTSPLAPPLATVNPALSQRGAFLTIRYQRASGTHFVPLGGAAGSGSGQLTGTIYLDANDNNQIDAGEEVAPNVTVVLDGRYSTRTDNNGHFAFPAVATGHHTLNVVPDNLPLPWTLADNGRVEVEVRTRDHTDVSIGAHRVRFGLNSPSTSGS